MHLMNNNSHVEAEEVKETVLLFLYLGLFQLDFLGVLAFSSFTTLKLEFLFFTFLSFD